MKIAIVSDAVYPYHKGGKERRFYEITTRLAKKGHDVHIYCMKWWDADEEVRYEHGVHLHAISPYFPLYNSKRRNIKQGIFFGFYCLKLIKEDWDIIEVDHIPYFPLFYTKLVCLLKGKKMYATWNEVWGKEYWVKYLGKAGYLSALLEWMTIFTPNRFIAISQHTAKKLQNVFNVPKHKIDSVSTGIDIESIEKVPTSKNISDVIYAGRLLKHKNVHVLLQAISQLVKTNSKISCLIVGNGPEKKRLIKLAQELDLKSNVRFLDFLPHHNEVFSLMKASKVFVSPSTREGFGMAVLEANACCIPAIVIDHPDNAATDLIEGINGAVVPLETNTLAREIERQLKRKRDPENVKKVANKYSWNRIVEKLEEVYGL